MRPRRCRRGERRKQSPIGSRRASFNAATAVSPWRTSGTLSMSAAAVSCFNAATAGGPWGNFRPAKLVGKGAGVQSSHGGGGVGKQRGVGEGAQEGRASMRGRRRRGG